MQIMRVVVFCIGYICDSNIFHAALLLHCLLRNCLNGCSLNKSQPSFENRDPSLSSFNRGHHIADIQNLG